MGQWGLSLDECIINSKTAISWVYFSCNHTKQEPVRNYCMLNYSKSEIKKADTQKHILNRASFELGIKSGV
jgi:hypothetical protein